MAKIQLGKKLNFGKPIDLGDALGERSKLNVQLANQIILREKSPSKTSNKKMDFGKKINLGKELCL